MKTAQIIISGLALMIVVLFVTPVGNAAQDSSKPDSPSRFTQEELTQMLAPIALYPDSLIAQVLMASTYPLEVVEAERWLRQNEGLKSEALDNALKTKPWDPSVTSLCHFPDVLFAMSEKLDQTSKLGNAYLAQQDDVMATIQNLRKKADEQGNLKTTEEQTVTNTDGYIRIEPADPAVVYVPMYDPWYVYGPWWYAAYPPWYWFYPPYFGFTGGYVGFGFGFFVGFGVSSWCWFDWPNHNIYVNYNLARPFHLPRPGPVPGISHWHHNPVHRRGVAYADGTVGGRFGQARPRGSSTAPGTRGYPARTYERRAGEPSRSSIERPKGSFVPRQRVERERLQSGAWRGTPPGGTGRGDVGRMAGQRGVENRRSSPQRYWGGNAGRQSGGPSSGSYRSGGQGGGYPGGAPMGGLGGRQGGGAPSGGHGGGFHR